MPLSKATHGFGSELWLKPSAAVIARVAEIDDIPELPLGSERELYETSNFDTVGFKEFKKLPLKDGVPVTIAGNYVINSASDTLLQAAEDAEGAIDFRIVIREGADVFWVTGTALFYNLKRTNPKDAKRTFSIEMKAVGVVTVAKQP